MFNGNQMEDHICPYCKAEVSRVAIFCEQCGFPLEGSEQEKADFLKDQASTSSLLRDTRITIGRTQIILYVIAVFQFLNAAIAYVNAKDHFTTIFFVSIGLLLAIFSYFSKKRPIVCIALSLATMLGYYAYLYTIHPNFLSEGLLWKLAIILFLAFALFDAIYGKYIKDTNTHLKD